MHRCVAIGPTLPFLHAFAPNDLKASEINKAPIPGVNRGGVGDAKWYIRYIHWNKWLTFELCLLQALKKTLNTRKSVF